VLNDEQINHLAQQYLHRHYGPRLPGVDPLWEFDLVREFNLEDPCGVYYTVKVIRSGAAVEGDDHAHFPPRNRLVGDGGFFIDGLAGTVRSFRAGDFFYASDIVTGDVGAIAGIEHGTADPRQVIKYLLTHTTDALRSDFNALLDRRPAKRWWEFWK